MIASIPKDGGSRTDLGKSRQLPCHKEFDGFKDVYGRLAWEKPAPTITCGFVNPSKGLENKRFLADVGDWIIKGVKGEFYAIKPDIFEETYEAVANKATDATPARST